MIRPPAYVIGPLASDAPEGIAWNIARACAIARLAVREGLAPICVHAMVDPIFGGENPVARAIGLDVDEVLVGLVARASHGRLVVLLRDDGSASDGMLREWAAWRRARTLSPLPTIRAGIGVEIGRWLDWRARFGNAGMGAAWTELEDPPVPGWGRRAAGGRGEW